MNYIDKMIPDEELDKFISILTDYTGIVPRASHRDGIKNFIERKLSDSNFSIEEYKEKLISDKKILAEFINQSTVNETYFFREEKQFIVLKEKIFPQWKINNPKKNIKIWSAACSYGEEAYSLAILALEAGLNPDVIATDINSKVLQHCESGVFLGTSLRTVDGVQFQKLVLPYRRIDGRIGFSDDIKKHIETKQLNLTKLDSAINEDIVPKEQNIIFLRNVFIYFSLEMREKILRIISEKCLAEDGCLFVSMNEIAQLDFFKVPDCLEKKAEGNIFYFHKKCASKGGIVNG